MAGSVSVLCGHLLVVGLAGTTLGEEERRALAAGTRAGVVLFRRNVPEDVRSVSALNAAVASAQPNALVAVDQEGGRVVRLRGPLMALPPMRALGDSRDVALIRKVAAQHARELRALGFTMSFAPVLDVHTRDENPIIGDRAFATTPEGVATLAGAWADGLRDGDLLSCGKHYPGHGDTTVDSHLALPRVDRDREGLERIELAPFRALAKRVDSLMSAHVVYPAWDEKPATLSRAICTDMLRAELGFEGVLFSDDLEMKAITLGAGEAAVLAVLAGCDVLLVCSKADMADEVHAALVREAESSAAFRARCEEAAARSIALRKRVAPAVASSTELDAIFDASALVVEEMNKRLAS